MSNEEKNQGKMIVGILSVALISQINTIASVIMADLAAVFPHASRTAIQYVMQMGMVGAFPASLSAGFITRKIPIKTLLLTGILMILAGGLFPIVKHDAIPVLYICAFIVGAGQGFILPMLGTMILLNFTGAKKDRLVGFNMSFSTGGATVLLLVAGPVALTGWVHIYFLYAIAALVFVTAFICLPKGVTAPAASSSEKGGRVSVPPKGWIQCVITVMVFVCYVTFPLNIAMYIVEEGLGNAVTAGVAMSIVTVAGAALGLIFQPIVKKIKLFIGAFAALAGFLGMLTICLAGGISMIYVSAALLGVFFGAQISGGGYVISRICEPRQVAPTFSIIQSSLTLGVVLSPIIINFITMLWEGKGSRGSFITSTVIFGVFVIVQLIWNAYLTRTCALPEADQAKV